MREVKQEQLERLNQIDEEIKALEEEKHNIYERSLHGPDSEKVCEDWTAQTLSEILEDVEPRPVVQVRGYVQGMLDAMIPRITSGSFVAVRPCDKELENRTFLGMLLGDMATGLGVRYTKEIETIEVSFSGHNPAIWVFDLNRIVLGCGSWWKRIEDEEQLKSITDYDIQNAWHIRAKLALEKLALEKDK
jgi:hypothetical protein